MEKLIKKIQKLKPHPSPLLLGEGIFICRFAYEEKGKRDIGKMGKGMKAKMKSCRKMG